MTNGTSQVALMIKNLPANAGDLRDAGLIPGSRRSPGGGHGNPLQYSCLENPMDREPDESWTQLKGQEKVSLFTSVFPVRVKEGSAPGRPRGRVLLKESECEGNIGCGKDSSFKVTLA